MQMQIQGQIMGVKRFSGQIEGKNFDYCRVVVATPLDATQGNALGSSATEYDFGGSANFAQFQDKQFHLLFPNNQQFRLYNHCCSVL